jgi:integrase
MNKPIKCRDKWRIRYTDHSGIRRSAVYKTFKEAELELLKAKFEVEKLKQEKCYSFDPEIKVNRLVEQYVQEKTKFKKRPKDDLSIFSCHLIPFFGNLRAREITPAYIGRYRTEKERLTGKSIRNHLILLQAVFNHAKRSGQIYYVPYIEKPKWKLDEQEFSYLKSQNEIERFLSSAKQQGEIFYILYATAIYTGLRQGELAGLRWDDIDFEKRLIRVERSFESTTKSGKARYAPILDALINILKEWRLKNQSHLVFPNESGNMYKNSARIFQEYLHKVLDHAGFIRKQTPSRQVHYIRFHDLRHTFASHWVMNGGSIFKLQQILGHQSIQMTMRYAHLAPEAFRDDYGRLSTPSLLGTLQNLKKQHLV